MKKLSFSILILLLSNGLSFSQIAINTDGAAPDASAGLDVSYTNKGFLPPRMTLAQIEAISNPANGLVVFCTTDDKFYAYIEIAGTWKQILFSTGVIIPGFSCGSSITISHVVGAVSPVTKDVTYGTINNIPGEPSKCWITSNLGADHQATAKNDDTEASAGWYWQFNRMQGYKHDGSARIPNTTWITSINENSDWLTGNDPCVLLLGSGWRLPTSTEWDNVDVSGGWTSWSGPWNSSLKLHAAGSLNSGDGTLYGRGSQGFYWSSSQLDNTIGRYLSSYEADCHIGSVAKSYGFSSRCLRD